MRIKPVNMKSFKSLITTNLLICGVIVNSFSQVAINDNGALPAANAILDISCSTNDKGVLIPRLTSAEIDAMGGVTTGMMIFNTDVGDVQFYQGASWEPVGSVDNKTLFTGSDTLSGNTTVTFLGSKLNFTASSVNAFNIADTTFSVDAANNWVGIGTAAPSTLLHISGNSGVYSSTGLSNAPLYVETSGSTDLPVNAYFNATGPTDSFIRHRFANNGNSKWQIIYSDNIDFLADIASDGTWTSEFKINNNGTITFNDTYTFPATDGTANQVLETNGTGVLSWVTNTASGVTLAGTETLTNKTLTTPIINTSINDSNSNELIIFNTTASSINAITIQNGAIGTGPTLSATGDDTNIDLVLQAAGTGKISLSGIKFPNADGANGQILKTDGSGNLSWANSSTGNVTLTGTETLTNKTLTTPVIGTSIIDASSNELIVFGTVASAVNSIRIQNASTTMAPILAADGDDTNIDLILDPKGAGAVIINGLKFPIADGTTKQYLRTDGSGSLVWESLGNQQAWQSVTFSGTWVNYAGYATCQYYKDNEGVVHVKGVASSGATATSVIFTLPVGYRPTENRMFAGSGNDAFTTIIVGSDGTVKGSPGNTTFTSLEFSFRP